MAKLLALLILSILQISISQQSVKDASWGYRKEYELNKNIVPSKWHEHHPKCGGHFQSPTQTSNLQTPSSVKISSK